MRRTALAASSLVFALAACDGQQNTPTQMVDVPDMTSTEMFIDNPPPESWGIIPKLDLGAFDFPVVKAFAPTVFAAGLTPGTLTATLNPGETVVEAKTADLAGGAPMGDVLFAFDLTGSMGGELANVKANAVAIMTAVSGVIPDVQFGLASHEDYTGFFSTSTALGHPCNYSASYGSSTDEPYRLDQAITANQATVAAAINAMVLGSGNDGPESYTRIFYESYADLVGDPNPTYGPVGWRPGAKKIVVAFGDNIPHDCDYDAIIGGTSDSGLDPGRDNTIGTADDLRILDVLAGMDANNVTLINLFSGGTSNLPLWDAYAAETGGTNFLINFDGSFPGGISPATAISDLIEEEVSSVDQLTLEVCSTFSPAFDPWIVSVNPASHDDLTLPVIVDFDLEVGPPLGTAPGTYTFDVCLIGDGAEFGRQTVNITVPGGGACDPLALLDDLADLIEEMVDDGIIPGRIEPIMMGFVHRAIHALTVGNREGPNPFAAGRHMRHLMGYVETAKNDGRISEENAQELMDAAAAVNLCLGVSTTPKPPREESARD